MTPQECVNAIRAIFPGGTCSEQMILDATKYIVDLGLGPIQTDVFYTTIRNNYEHEHRYFPSMKAIQNIWGSRYGGGGFESYDFDRYQTSDCIEKTKHWSIMRIVKGVNAIRDHKKCQHSGCKDKTECTTQIMLVKTWGELASIYYHLIDLEWEERRIMSYLEKIKETIVSGQEPKFDIEFHQNEIKDTDVKRGTLPRPTRSFKKIMEKVEMN